VACKTKGSSSHPASKHTAHAKAKHHHKAAKHKASSKHKGHHKATKHAKQPAIACGSSGPHPVGGL
jgi:hypothetical protein